MSWEDTPAQMPMAPLDRYFARHTARPYSSIPDEHLLLLSIAMDTRIMRQLAEENQAYIRYTMDNMNEGQNDGHKSR